MLASGIWTIDADDKIKHRVRDVQISKRALWIHRYDLAHQTVSVYLVKRRTIYVRMKDWFINGWAYDKWEFVISLVAMGLVPLWVLLVILGL